MLRPFASFGESLRVVRRDRFVVDWGVGNGARHRIKQAFKHPDRRRRLARRQSLHQFVSMLFFCRHNTAISPPRYLTAIAYWAGFALETVAAALCAAGTGESPVPTRGAKLSGAQPPHHFLIYF